MAPAGRRGPFLPVVYPVELAGVRAHHNGARRDRQHTVAHRNLGSPCDLPLAGAALQLLQRIGDEHCPHAAGAHVATAGVQRIRTLQADVTGVEVMRLSALDAAPTERLKEVLREHREAVIWREQMSMSSAVMPEPL